MRLRWLLLLGIVIMSGPQLLKGMIVLLGTTRVLLLLR